MKLINKSPKFNKDVYTLQLDESEKFMSESELMKIFKDMTTQVYFGFGSRIQRFEDRLEITVYTD